MDLFRSARLDEAALDENADAVGDGSHLVEVVADVDCGRSGFSLDSSQLQEDAVACLVVEGADWLVEQEEFWLGCEGSCERHALTLAPGEPFDSPGEEVLDPKHGGHLPDCFMTLRRMKALQAKRELDVSVNRSSGKQRVVLGDIPNAAVAGFGVVNTPAINLDGSAGGASQAGDAFKEKRLAAARFSEQDKVFSALDVQRHVLESELAD
jgi:hypothetical protein